MDSFPFPDTIAVVDSHTEGEPTRVVVGGWPQPEGDTMAARRDDLARRFDPLRQAVVCEPRGHDAVVGALLTPPVEPGSLAGVVFFNNAGYLGMCGHGLIGVVRTLAHMGRLRPGTVRIDTPAGTVEAELAEDGSIAIENVPARLAARDVAVDVPALGRGVGVVGDVAYGGNWFFLTRLPGEPIELANVDRLLAATRAILAALSARGIAGDEGAAIDHVEVFGPPGRPDADSRSFVLCPGGAFDRSPCGTGTSAKMAALHARGELALGAPWRQESVTGSLFTGWLTARETAGGAELVPHVRGRASITAEATLRFAPDDPFRGGFRVG
jgi:proline racemase